MKNLSTYLMILVCMYSSTCVYSQNDISFTGRYGINTIGITAAMPVSIKGGLEGMFTIGHDNSRYLFTGLYEERYMIADNPDLVWFAGVGLHVGYRKIGIPAYIDILKDRLVEPVIIPATTEKHLIGGADAIIGITFRFPGIPIIIGLDMKPNTDFINAGSMMVDGGIRAGLSF